MGNIRIVIENKNVMPFVYEGERKHYIDIDTRDYEFDQLSKDTTNKIYEWGYKYNIGITAWDELKEILSDV